MLITATEFKRNFGKYLALAASQDIYITRNGKSIVKVSSTTADKIAILESLAGIVSDKTTTLDDIRTERLKKHAYPR